MLRLKTFGLAVWGYFRLLAKPLLLLPLPALMLWLGLGAAYREVPRHENQYERDSAVALLSGKALQQFDQMNERLFFQELVDTLQRPFDTIALGSSRVLQLTAEAADGGTFYNCGFSGADYRDIMTAVYRLEKAGMLPQNVVIGLDPWLLNGAPDVVHPRSDAGLFEEFCALRLGYDNGFTPDAPPEQKDFRYFFSPEVLRETYFAPLARDNYEPQPPLLVEGDSYESPYQSKMPDGSVLYGKAFREAGDDVVGQRAMQEAVGFLHMDGYIAPDPTLCELFHRFVQYLRALDVQVVFLMMPYHPTVYDYAAENAGDYPGFFLTEAWFSAYARAYDIPLYGSYNPYVAGAVAQDFYDGLHIRREAVSKVFPGVRAVRAARQAGLAPQSPWLAGGPRISYEAAQAAVALRYGFTADEYAARGDDVVINGQLCYVVERYAPRQGGDLLLARYAATRRNCTVYRRDNITGQWTIDERLPRDG